MAGLTRELLAGPQRMRASVVDRAEALHDDLDPASSFPLSFVRYRLTRVREELHDDPILVGDALRADLRQLIDRVSRAQPGPPPSNSQTIAELAEAHQVSTRTIHRWRGRGLRYRWCQSDAEARPHLRFTEGALNAFERERPGVVQRASTFHRLSDQETARVIFRAARLARECDVPPTRIVQHLARRTGHAAETLRLLIHRHDAPFEAPTNAPSGSAANTRPTSSNLSQPVFPDRRAPLTDRQRRVAARAAARGIPVVRIAERLGRSRNAIYRLLREQRLQHALSVELQFVHSVLFDREDAEQLLGSDRQLVGGAARVIQIQVEDLPPSIQSWYERPPVSDDLAAAWLRRLHYARFRAQSVRDATDPNDPRTTDLDQFDHWHRRAADLAGRLVHCALPLVLSVARRHLPKSKAHRDSIVLLRLLVLGHDELYRLIDQHNPFGPEVFRDELAKRLLRRLGRSDVPSLLRSDLDRDDPMANEAMIRLLRAGARRAGVRLKVEA